MKDSYVMSLENVTGKGAYKVGNMKVNATGEYSTDAKRSKAGDTAYAGEQMSDGSMNYLEHNDRRIAKDVAKIKGHKNKYQ